MPFPLLKHLRKQFKGRKIYFVSQSQIVRPWLLGLVCLGGPAHAWPCVFGWTSTCLTLCDWVDYHSRRRMCVCGEGFFTSWWTGSTWTWEGARDKTLSLPLARSYFLKFPKQYPSGTKLHTLLRMFHIQTVTKTQLPGSTMYQSVVSFVPGCSAPK